MYVFVKPKAGWASAAWPMNESEKLTPSDAVPGQYFGGSAVAISGDTTVIAAMFDDDNSGAAYVFVNCGGSWVQQAKLLASDGEAWDWFGYSVAISGDTIIVGADQNYNNGPGVAYVFKKPLTGWEDNMTEDAKLTASDGAATDDFGVSVAISGDTALIGTFEDDDNFNNSGSAYIFAVGGDCNDNGVVDQCEIADGASQDSNEDGVPDECQNCAADLNGDGVVGPADLAILLASWGTCVK